MEYSLIAASIAFVGAAGLGAITGAQRSYFDGLPLDPPAPAAPGALMHPTSIDPPQCLPTNLGLGGTITCNPPAIYDVFSNPTDRNPPLGYIGLHLDGELVPRAFCQVVPLTSNKSACATQLTWTTSPGDVSLLTPSPTHNLTLWYECRPASPPPPFSCSAVPVDGGPARDLSARSNHFSSNSVAQTVTFQTYAFTGQPTCTYDLRNPGTNQVEIGRPIRCEIGVEDLRTPIDPLTGRHGPAVGLEVMWKAPIMPGSSGVPMLTCHVGYLPAPPLLSATLFLTPPGNPCDPINTSDPRPTMGVHCTTSTNGNCSVIYRRVRELSGSNPLGSGNQDLVVSVQAGALTMTASTPPPIVVVPSYTVNQADTWLVCGSGPGVTVGGSRTITNGTYLHVSITSDLNVVAGGTAPCQTFVVDKMPSTGNDCIPGPQCVHTPDLDDGYAPVGDVTFNLCDASSNCTQIATCNLQRSAVLPLVAPNGTPFSSDCAVSLPLTGTAGQTYTLKAMYSGTTHSNSNDHYDVQVHF